MEIPEAAKRILRPAADALTVPAELMWRKMLGVSRRWWPRPEVRPWVPDADRVCIVAPHPDDETLGAGGVAVLHREAGARVHIVVVTTGAASRALAMGPVAMAERRREELECAMEIIRPWQVTTLGFAERTGNGPGVEAALQSHLSAADVVYAPSCVDFHPDHLWIAQAVAAVVRPEQRVRCCELGVPLTPVLVNCVADIGPVEHHKTAALRCYTSQARTIGGIRRLERYGQQLYGLSRSEVFWELSAPRYRDVMHSSGWRWEESPFRSIRYRAFTDPLAYLAGVRVRWGLRELVADETPASPST